MKEGLYYSLLTEKLEKLLSDEGLKDRAEFAKCESQDVARLISHELAMEIRKYLEDELADKDDLSQSRNIIQAYFNSHSFKELLDALAPKSDHPEILTEIKHIIGAKAIVDDGNTWVGPSSLIVPGMPGPQLVECLRRELRSCDQVEWLVSFLKTSGVDEIYEDLRAFCSVPRADGKKRLKIATTTYIGASDVKAIKKLIELPNTEIRMSFDSKHQRLHAKAYLFHRDNGFSTAYIGSANLSGVAITTGLEWTSKITQWEMPHLWNSAKCAFLKSWENDQEFKTKTPDDLNEIKTELDTARGILNSGTSNSVMLDLALGVRPYQLAVLEDIDKERKANRHRHLVVAATGTGKTMMAAFDLQRLKVVNNGQVPSTLYIVHRQDILKQVRDKYRAVLKDGNFGVILPDDQIIGNNTRHIFCTPVTWRNKIKGIWPHIFDNIIIDECHHAAAESYEEIISYYGSDIEAGRTDLLGLTATPDRDDGKDIRVLFGGQFTHELSLAYAINEGFLVPYRYMISSDVGVNYTSVNWRNKAQAESEVAALVEANTARALNVLNQVLEHVPDEHEMRAIGFCAGVKHAEFMAKFFSDHGIPSVALQGRNTDKERKDAIESLNSSAQGSVNVIFTADLFNEGIDIPNVDTLLMLRPTNSVTIFTQQLGRGLRQPEFGYKKTSLLVLDFVSDQNNMFDETMRLRILTETTGGMIHKKIASGMFSLPAGCTLTMSTVAKETILRNIKNRLKTLRGQNLINQIIRWVRDKGAPMSMKDILDALGIDDAVHVISQTKSIPSAISEAALDPGKALSLKEQERFAKMILRINQTDDYALVSKWVTALISVNAESLSDGDVFKFATCYDFQKTNADNFKETWNQVIENDPVRNDVVDFLQWKLERAIPQEVNTCPESNGLLLHCRYNRTQITQELGLSMGYLPQSGVVPITGKNITAFFVTREKSESEFTPETMYKDFAITPDKFKWDSKNSTKASSNEAKRYIDGSCTPLLFIQRYKTADLDVPEGFVYLGPLEYVAHEGECPIAFEWKLKYPMPAKVFQWAK